MLLTHSCNTRYLLRNLYFWPFANLGIGIGIEIEIETDIANAIISTSIRPMSSKLSMVVT